MAERIPGRDEIRSAILYLSRLYLSYNGRPYSGPLRVSVVQPEERETRSFKPKGTLEGMEPPKWLAIGDEDGIGAGPTELLRVLLSPDEAKLMTDLVTHQPCSATSVMQRSKGVMGTSDFWAVWGQLQKRELVEQGDDDRYRVGPVWLADWLKAKKVS